jgi:competence protein ComEC
VVVLARAPFLPILTGIVAILALSDRVVFWTLPPIAALTAFGVAVCSFRGDRESQWRVAAFMLVCTFLCASWIVFSLTPPTLPYAASFVETAGTVVDSRPWGRLYAVSVKTPKGGFVLKLPFDSLPEGSRVKLKGLPAPFRGHESENGFREDRYWYARGMTAQLAYAETELLEATPLEAAQSWNIHRWRYDLYRALAIHVPSLTRKYLNAAWTGKRDKDLDARHRAWGTSHLLAVSGFHVGVVMFCASLFFRRGRTRVLALTFLLWFYVFLTGAPASAVRAGLMIQIALAGELFGRPGSALNSVSLAAVLLLLWSPFRFWDLGWRLSVLAALVIAAVLERKAPGDWKAWLVSSPLIWAATFPQVSAVFPPVPLVGIPLNCVALPFFSAALSSASGFAALRLLGAPGAGFLLNAAEGAFTLWGVIADAAARLIPWQAEGSPLIAFCCAVVFLALLCRALFVPWRGTAVLASLGALAAFALFGG